MDASIGFYDEATVNIHDVPQGDFVKWAAMTGAEVLTLTGCDSLRFQIGKVDIVLYDKKEEE